MANLLVIGATGDVGRGIVEILLERGHRVAAAARGEARLQALADALGRPAALIALRGSLENDESAERLRDDALRALGRLDGVVVSVNAPRVSTGPLIDKSSDELASLLRQDLISHFSAARAFLPTLADGGTYVGIGGGTADFLLPGGAYMSVGQAALRMMYRGLAAELAGRRVHLRELIIASVVNGASNRADADPAWVTDREIGEQVAAILDAPDAYRDTIVRMSRRNASGRPVVSFGH